MPSPFPGMDPYLEQAGAWTNVHARLIVAIADVLGPQLRPTYRVVVEKAVYQTTDQDNILVGIPDVTIPQLSQKRASTTLTSTPAAVAQPVSVTVPIPKIVRQGYLEIREISTEQVITVIEVLSPTNKRLGQGRSDYEAKREKIFASSTHLVEIDLLRSAPPLPVLSPMVKSDYRILVSNSETRPQAQLYAFNLPDAIPVFAVPLQRSEGLAIDLKPLLDDIYDRSGYDLIIDYAQPPSPPLSDASQTWARDWLRQQGVI